MRDFLQDLVAHTHALGFLPLVKVNASDKETVMESMSEDRSVIMTAQTKEPISEVTGTFGMPNMNKLDIHLKCPEYRSDANIKVILQDKNGKEVPTGLHFSNKSGDFENDYRFMNAEVINEKLKTVKFKGANWEVSFSPSMAAIQRLKFQANANAEETVFKVATKDDNLIFSFGDASTHAGSFVFEAGVTGKLKNNWQWPIQQVQSILNLPGDIQMKIADAGALSIEVDSGLANYTYVLPAMSK